jgi:hypothetical protein
MKGQIMCKKGLIALSGLLLLGVFTVANVSFAEEKSGVEITNRESWKHGAHHAKARTKHIWHGTKKATKRVGSDIKHEAVTVGHELKDETQNATDRWNKKHPK